MFNFYKKCVWFFSMFIATFLAIRIVAIPQAWALNMPNHLQCEFYLANKRGWGCARFGSFFDEPMLSIVVFIVQTILIYSISEKDKVNKKTVTFSIFLYIGIVAFLSSIIALVYFLQGKANLIYGGIFGVIMLLILIPISISTYRLTKKEKMRKELINKGIEIEIAERLSEKEKY